MRRKIVKSFSVMFVFLIVAVSFSITVSAISLDGLHGTYTDSGYSYESFNRITGGSDSFTGTTYVRCTNKAAGTGYIGVQAIVYTESGARLNETIMSYNQYDLNKNDWFFISTPCSNPMPGNYKAQGVTRALSASPGIYDPYNQYGTFATGYYTVY